MAKRFNIKGRFKYICLDCGAGTYFSTVERDRAARIRCAACGSAHLEESTGYAKAINLNMVAASNERRIVQK